MILKVILIICINKYIDTEKLKMFLNDQIGDMW